MRQRENTSGIRSGAKWRFLLSWLGLLTLGPPSAPASSAPSSPDVLLVVVDTLRADHLSSYGYARATSPEIDRLLASGVRFTQARTDEPLTSPAMCSLITGVEPDDHGSTRNGLRMQSGLPSLPKVLRRAGWETVAFVGNWTLKDEISGLGEHFDLYESTLTRRRWLGLVAGEARGKDLTDRALDWLDEHLEDGRDSRRPFFLWVHYVEPHGPYRAHREFAGRLGLSNTANLPKIDRYDTEIAAVDREIGRLLRGVRHALPTGDLLTILASDHGESLGEHGYWGHGRHLYEPTVHIPLGVIWPGRLEPQTSDFPALITDLAPTVLDLLGLPMPPSFSGSSLRDALYGGNAVKRSLTCHQAHRGAVQVKHESDKARTRGLLAVGIVADGRKEIYRPREARRMLFDFASDPREARSLVDPDSEPSPELRSCLDRVYAGLTAADRLPVPELDDEAREQLRALGYLD